MTDGVEITAPVRWSTHQTLKTAYDDLKQDYDVARAALENLRAIREAEGRELIESRHMIHALEEELEELRAVVDTNEAHRNLLAQVDRLRSTIEIQRRIIARKEAA